MFLLKSFKLFLAIKFSHSIRYSSFVRRELDYLIMSSDGNREDQGEVSSPLDSNTIDAEVKIKEETLEEDTRVNQDIPLYDPAFRPDLENQPMPSRSESPALSIRLRRPGRASSEMHAFTTAGVAALTNNRLLQARLKKLMTMPHSEDEFPDDELAQTSESQFDSQVHNAGYSQPSPAYPATFYQQYESQQHPAQLSGYRQDPFLPEYSNQFHGSFDRQFPQSPYVEDLDQTMSNSSVPPEDFSASPTPTPQQEVLLENRAPSTPRAGRQAKRESAKSRAHGPSTAGRRRRARRAEDFAPPPGVMTAADVMAVHENNIRRRNKRYKKAGIKPPVLDDIEQDVVDTLNELGVPIDFNDMYLQQVYSNRDTTLDGSLDESADSTIDTMDTDETIVPLPPSLPAEPDFPTSARWRERGPDGQARARWGSARLRAKKKVQKTDAWKEATKDERDAMEAAAADALVFM